MLAFSGHTHVNFWQIVHGHQSCNTHFFNMKNTFSGFLIFVYHSLTDSSVGLIIHKWKFQWSQRQRARASAGPALSPVLTAIGTQHFLMTFRSIWKAPGSLSPLFRLRCRKGILVQTVTMRYNRVGGLHTTKIYFSPFWRLESPRSKAVVYLVSGAGRFLGNCLFTVTPPGRTS